MKSPLVSISLQTYNRAGSGYLRQALEGILRQTYRDFELLVIDNHSTDNTAEIVLSYEDSRLTYLRLPPGGTPNDSIGAAFRAARGDYLLTTHDDDIMEPEMLEKQMACIDEHPELLCLATNVSLIDTQGTTLQPKLYEMDDDRLFMTGDYIQTYFEEKLWLPTPTLLFRRDFPVSRKRPTAQKKQAAYFPSGDIAGLFRRNAKGSIGILAAPLLRYRQHPGQESRNVHQSGPLVTLAQYAEKLLATRGANDRLRSLLPMVRAFSARYRAQDCLFTLQEQQLQSQLNILKRHWEKRVPPNDRAVDAALPFEILLAEMQLGYSIPLDAFERLSRQAASSGSQQGYRQWLGLLHKDDLLFSPRQEFRRIAIFGSMLTAYLLVLSARKSGIEVVCCIDSSSARIGNKVFGVPIVPHEHLETNGKAIDAVILSSERDHEEGLKEILRPYREHWEFNVLSWKELTSRSVD